MERRRRTSFGFRRSGVLVGLERVLLTHQANRDGSPGDPGLRVLRLDLHQIPRDRIRFFQTTEGQQRRSQFPPGERDVCGLLEGMTQQAFGVVGLVGRQRERRKPDQRGDVPRIYLQDFAKHTLGALAVVCQHRSRGFFDVWSVRIGQPGTLKRDARVRHTAPGRPAHRRMPATPNDDVASSPVPAAPLREPARPGPLADRHAPDRHARSRNRVRPRARVRVGRCRQRACSWSSSAAPSNHCVLSSEGACVASARSTRSAVAARPARSARCAWRRVSSKADSFVRRVHDCWAPAASPRVRGRSQRRRKAPAGAPAEPNMRPVPAWTAAPRLDLLRRGPAAESRRHNESS